MDRTDLSSNESYRGRGGQKETLKKPGRCVMGNPLTVRNRKGGSEVVRRGGKRRNGRLISGETNDYKGLDLKLGLSTRETWLSPGVFYEEDAGGEALSRIWQGSGSSSL